MNAVFVFIDEVGVGFSPDQPLFGVGLLVIEDAFTLNRAVHDVFTGAVSFYHKHKTRFEFKFNAITSNNLRFYQEIVKILKKEKSWYFIASFIEKDLTKWNSQDYWAVYLQLLDKCFDQIPFKHLTIVADYLAKPKLINIDFAQLKNKKKIINILQLESQGSLLLQTTDILLGAIHFEYRRNLLNQLKSKTAKLKLALLVQELLKEAEKDGRVKVQK